MTESLRRAQRQSVGESNDVYVCWAKRTRRGQRSDGCSSRLLTVAKVPSARAFHLDDSKHRLGARHKVFVSPIRDTLRRVHSDRERRARQTFFKLYFVGRVRRTKRRPGRAARGAVQRTEPRDSVGAVRDTKQSPFRGREIAEPDHAHGMLTEQNSHERVLQRLAPGNANHT